MKRFIWILPIFVLILLSACAVEEIAPRNYYVMEYYPHTEVDSLKRDTPFPYKVLISEAEIARTYTRRQIVLRHFGPKLVYSDYDNWGGKLSEMVSDLVTQRFRRYNVFTKVHEEFYSDLPDFEIDIIVNNIELYTSDVNTNRAARLNIEFQLKRVNEQTTLLSHSVNRVVFMVDDEIETFVQMVNQMLLEETDHFIEKITVFFEKGITPEDIIASASTSADSLIRSSDNDEELPSGMGLLLLPAISESDEEPYFIVTDTYGMETTGRMGEPLPLWKGKYTLRMGSGDYDQMIRKDDVEIVPRFKTLINPMWGALKVKIVDESRNYAKVRYEIFDQSTGESFGSDFPAEEDIGERDRVWLLHPGLYKVTINNEPFNTYQNFTTVFLEEGSYQVLTIVVSTNEDGVPENLIGAGVLDETDINEEEEYFHLYSAIHANGNISSDNSNDQNNPTTVINANIQLDNRMIYDRYPYHLTSNLLVEAGMSKDEETDPRAADDSFSLRNTLVYYLVKSFGLYVRGDATTHFFPEKVYSTDERNYVFINENSQRDTLLAKDKVEVKQPWQPTELKEGFGVNWRILDKQRASLSTRLGLGFRQVYANDVFLYSYTDNVEVNDSTEVNYYVYNEVGNSTQEGVEFSVVASLELPFNLSYDSNLDILFPFDQGDPSYEWENILNLRLFKQVSLDYKFTLTYNEDVADYNILNHQFYLRLTYIIN